MIDILAGFSLAGAAAAKENPVQLIADAELLYGLYTKSKGGNFNIQTLASSGELKPAIQAAARLTAVANALSEDPAQLKNIIGLLASLS